MAKSPHNSRPDHHESPDQVEQGLRQMAEQWRRKLADPVLRREIQAGRLTLSPLVQKLLLAFPPARTQS